jgi:hypothetical protein
MLQIIREKYSAATFKTRDAYNHDGKTVNDSKFSNSWLLFWLQIPSLTSHM